MAIARVQFAHGGVGSAAAASFDITMGSTTGVGNTIVVAVIYKSSSDIKVSAVGGGDLVCAKTTSAFDATAQLFTAIYWGRQLSTGVTLYRVATSSGGTMTSCGIAVEYSGSNLFPSTEPSAANGSSASPITGSNTNTGHAVAMFTGAIGIRESATVNTTWASNPTNSFTIVDAVTTNLNTGANNDAGMAFTELAVSSIAAKSSQVDSSFGAQRYAGSLISFYEILTGGGLRAAGHGGLAA